MARGFHRARGVGAVSSGQPDGRGKNSVSEGREIKEPVRGWRRARVFVAVGAIAIAVRVVLWAVVGSIQPFVGDDQENYLEIRDTLRSTHTLVDPATGERSAFRDPGYPVFLALLGQVGLESPRAVIAAQIVLSAAAVALLASLSVTALGPAAGAWTAGLALAQLSLATYPLLILSETLFVFLLVAALSALHCWWRGPHVGAQVLVGVLVSACLLTRFAAALGMCLLLLGVLGVARRPPREWAILVCLPLLAVGLWSLRNWQAVGVFAPNTSGAANVYMGNNPVAARLSASRPEEWDAVVGTMSELPERERSAWALKKTLEFVREHPGQAARQILWKIPDALEFDRMLVGVGRRGQFPDRSLPFLVVLGGICALVTAVPSILALAACLQPERHWLTLGGVAFFVGVLLTQMLTVGHPRYTLPAWIALLPGAAVVLQRVVRNAPGTRRLVAISAAILIAVWIREVLQA
jgi:hypothetical protein